MTDSPAHGTLPLPLHLLQCSTCSPPRIDKATSITLYNRSFVHLPSSLTRRHLYAEVEVLSIERTLDAQSYLYTVKGVFKVRCPKCKAVRTDTHAIVSIPLQLLRDLATCQICWNTCTLVESHSKFERGDNDIDMVTVSGVARCDKCHSSREATRVAHIPASEHMRAYILKANAESKEPSPIPQDGAIDVFFSYSHKDRELRDKLETHLSLLKRQGYIKTWHDREIGPGDAWREKIDEKLWSAHIILLLVSADFIASEYCYGVELQTALERRRLGSALVVPIILRPADWSCSPFGDFQALPAGAKPLTTWANRDEGFTDVARGLRKLVEELRARRSAESAVGPVDV